MSMKDMRSTPGHDQGLELRGGRNIYIYREYVKSEQYNSRALDGRTCAADCVWSHTKLISLVNPALSPGIKCGVLSAA